MNASLGETASIHNISFKKIVVYHKFVDNSHWYTMWFPAIWCSHFVYYVQDKQTPLLRVVDGYSPRANQCKVVKYFIQKKKMDTLQLSQVMQS